MRKTTLKKNVMFLAMFYLLSAVACTNPMGSGSTHNSPQESVDAERTQLYVFNTDFGVDAEWLMRAKERFEALHSEDESWELGKKGVQVVVTNSSLTAQNVENSILKNREEVYVTQGSDYRYLAEKGLLADVTTAVTTPLDGEGKSIEEKLSAQQRAYFGGVSVEEVGKSTSNESGQSVTAYYAIPYQFSHFGIVYNVELFDKMGYYFALEPTSKTTPFVQNDTQTKSFGADGLAGTSDDGLPATYEEFFLLCDYILSKEQTPLVWGGESYERYLHYLTNALATDVDGYEQTILQYTLDGTATNLGTIQNATFMEDEEDTLITAKNGYELARSYGNFQALSFLKRLISPSTRYYDSNSFRKNNTQADAQENFVWKGKDGELSDVAMLVDGSWWESDASKVFQTLAGKNGEACQKENRRFGWMPFPKASQEMVGQGSTIFDCLSSMVFIKSNVADWKKPLAEEFLRFLCTDEELREYTKQTGSTCALEYTLTEEDVEGLTYFGKSLLAARESAKIVYPYSTSELYLKNERFFSVAEKWRASFVFASPDQYPIHAFKSRNVSVIDYFRGMAKYRADEWKDLTD